MQYAGSEEKDRIELNFKVVINGLNFQHNFKKVRNNIEKSRDGGVRHLQIGSKYIEWEQWKLAYRWDQQENTLSVHERLTEDHFHLGYASRMRNHLATDVLDKKMLDLFKV